ncbi:WxL protein peptidoglycan domain-containing protein [Spongisporangium articulatum]|uniref:WxL protein peptidoglycan domain-containing protein n=1 Tax=Spongisporangium articulatum TaxID=3362603 RepID=A0ABW8AGP9_9ACTN
MSQHAPRPRRAALRSVVIALVAATALAAPAAALAAAPASAASDDGRRSFGVQPAGPQKPDTRPNFTYRDVKPGARFYDHVSFVNISDRPVTLSVYAADAFNTATGAFDLKKPDQKSDDVGAWVSLIRNKVTVPARSSWVTPITVTIPKNAEPGDHAGGIVASLKTQTKDARGNSVTVDSRVATRFYIRVAGDLRPHLTLEKPHGSYLQKFFGFGVGGGRVTYTVRNDGNVRLIGDQSVRVSTLLGTSRQARNLPAVPEILPGGSYSYTATAKTVLPTFLVNSHVTIDPRSVTGNVDPATAQVNAGSWFGAVYWPLVAILIGLAVWVALRLRRRARRNPTPGAPGAPGPAGPGGDLSPSSSSRVPAALFVAGILTLGGLFGAAPAQAVDHGALTFIPGKGLDISPMYAVADAACPKQATSVIGTIRGKGFTKEGEVVIQNSSATISHNGAFGVPLGDTLNAFASTAGIKLDGPYTLSLQCVDEAMDVFKEFTGVVTFGDATHFTAPTPKVPPNEGVPMGFLAQTFPEFKQGPGPSAGSSVAPQGAGRSAVPQARPVVASTSTPILPFFLVIIFAALLGGLALAYARRWQVTPSTGGPVPKVQWADEETTPTPRSTSQAPPARAEKVDAASTTDETSEATVASATTSRGESA